MTVFHLASGHQSGQATTARNMEFTSITMLESGSTTCQILTSRAMTFARAVETTLILMAQKFVQSAMKLSSIKIKSGGGMVDALETTSGNHPNDGSKGGSNGNAPHTGSNPVLTAKK